MPAVRSRPSPGGTCAIPTSAARSTAGLRGRDDPLARNRAEREATGDPRLSVAEHYPSREAYLDRVRQAALALAREGYLLEADVPLSVAAGARLWDHFTR